MGVPGIMYQAARCLSNQNGGGGVFILFFFLFIYFSRKWKIKIFFVTSHWCLALQYDSKSSSCLQVSFQLIVGCRCVEMDRVHHVAKLTANLYKLQQEAHLCDVELLCSDGDVKGKSPMKLAKTNCTA